MLLGDSMKGDVNQLKDLTLRILAQKVPYTAQIRCISLHFNLEVSKFSKLDSMQLYTVFFETNTMKMNA